MAWGTTYLVTTEMLPPGRPLTAAVLRALPAGLLLLAVTRTLPPGSWWWRSAILGTLNIGAFFAFLFIAAYRLPGERLAQHPRGKQPDHQRLDGADGGGDPSRQSVGRDEQEGD